MAKQKSILRLEGTMGGITFVKTKDGYEAREQTSMKSSRIKSDPAFERTRENLAEFGRAAQASSVLRKAFRNQSKLAKDRRMIGRLIKGMMKVVQADSTNVRGQRNAVDGNVALLQGFQFNQDATLDITFAAQYQSSIDRVTGNAVVSIPIFTPATDIISPDGATHFKLVAAASEVNFATGDYNTVVTDSGILPWDVKPVPASQLTNALPANSTHPLFLVFGIQFYQVVNGVDYPLKNGIFNPLSIVNVSGS